MRAAKLAAAALALKRCSGAAAPFHLAFMTDQERAPHPELIARALPSGAAVILRDYDMPRRAALAARLLSICACRDLKLIIGADIRLAESIGAAGVHYPRWFMPDRRPGNRLIVSAACHDRYELARARELGAHVALLSPAYASHSHMRAPGLGPENFLKLAATSSLPVLALGGVNEKNAHCLAGPQVVGLAAIGAFTG
ncbi:thiamine phosphate synthase [Hyphococcus flavus]|uniref:Thiamine phosphate synthase n=1 Tax=Hyphococcus flavus TaxID=1866326 RepID=A0AAF0CGY0_9PROT|nr:thiamine phosphate synthase [Hyphococcus flavus]WDI32788.1 thiamine phosphate synthase [Hyphococcus flavus]